MKNWAQGRCRSNDGTSLRYFRSGSASGTASQPSVVFVHGFTDNALYFTRAAEALAEHFDVVAYDSRGHGQSDRATTPFDDASRIADLVTIVEQLKLDRPALIGHSMGAATIAQAIAAHPQLSRGVVLEDPAWSEPTGAEIEARRGPRSKYLAEWKQWVADLQAKPFAEALAQRRNDEPNWSPIDVETSLGGRLEFQLDLFDHFPMERSPWRPLIPQFDCPTLLLLGDNLGRGAIITRAHAEEAAQMNPLIQWTQIAGAGHHIKYDRFDEYIDEIITFLGPLR